MAKKKNKKGLKIALITIASILAAIGVFLFVFMVLLKPKEVPTYGFSGYVYADGEVLTGAKVSCGIMQTETDENGYYEFNKLTKVVEVTVSKDNYIFGKDLVFVNSNKKDINFYGFELFSLNGVVRNGNEVVPYAEIIVVSETGEYRTVANAFGMFSLPRLAGEVNLTATHDSVTLFSQTFNKTKEELVVSGTTNITGRINCDSETSHDFVLRLNDQIVNINEDLTFSINDVQPDSVITLESDNFYIENKRVVVSIENGDFQFNAEKFYNVSGKVVSGEIPLNNVRLIVGSTKTYTNSQGEFLFNSLHGDGVISASLQGYNFTDTNISNTNSVVNLLGTFDLCGRVYSDDNLVSNIQIVSNQQSVTTNARGEFVLHNVQLGDCVSIENANYFVENNDQIVSNTSNLTFALRKLYTLEVNIMYLDSPLANVTGILGQRSYVSNGDGKIRVPGLYGSNSIELEMDGYKFDSSYSTDYINSSLIIEPFKYYNVTGRVFSGDDKLANVTLETKGIQVVSDELGCFQITDLYESGSLSVECEGYNTQVINYSIDNNEFDINLNYDINGLIKCGELSVDNVQVSCGEKTTYSDYDGKFMVKGVYGTNTLSFAKEFYSIDNVDVADGCLVNIPSTYSIIGTASNKIGVISGLTIKLVRNAETTETITTITDEDGKYNFDNLTGEYLMIYDTQYEGTLLPNGYTVNCGGVYNFSDCGYKIKGRVMSGDIPVAGVVVSAGDLITTTNSNGYYKFDLIIEEEVLTLSKEGYTFVNNNLPIDISFDGREDVDFQCTYSIDGVINSGNKLLSNVKITVGQREFYTDQDGYYSIDGLSGRSELSAELQNYYFEIPNNINCAGEYNITAKFDSEIVVNTLNVPVGNVSIIVNGNEFITDENGVAIVTSIQNGDIVYISKEGYEIDSYTFSNNDESIQINAIYRIKGNVYVSNKALAGVKVECGGQVVLTDDKGYFEIVGLQGEHIITLSKDNYSFDDISITGYELLAIYAKYNVTGNVSVAGSGLENVTIKGGDKTVYTDHMGNYTIENLQEEVVLVIEKYGYEFPGEYIVNTPSVINIYATYRISGRVVSGDLEISGAQVKLSNGVTLQTNDSGYFETKGIEEVVSLEISAAGYNSTSIEGLCKFTNDIVANLTYTATINLTNITNLTDISITVGDKTDNYSASQIIFENLSGAQKISLFKEGYNFNPSQVIVSSDTNITIVVKKEFKVSGTITTNEGLPVSNVVVTAGGKETITDSNGYYEMTKFADPVQIKLVMKVVDTSYKGENYEYIVNIDQVSTDAVRNLSISSSEYAYYLFKKGYQNLNDALTYQIFGSGVVSDSASGEKQDVSIVYKKDSKNTRIIQNLNWHDGKIMNIVDPRIAQLTYVDMNSESVKYQTITGGNVSKGTANWTTNWTSTDYASYLNNFGVNAEAYYAYVITKDTISSTSNITLNNGLYQFTFSLAMTEAMYNYYTIQMSKMCSSQSFKSFKYCNITYTIGQDGYIRTMYIDEQYEVEATVVITVSSTVTDKITYNFYTYGPNEMINDIKISTVNEIKQSLTQETPVQYADAMSIDLYVDKRRKLL